MIFVLLIVGFALWYLYYGAECAINGANIARNPYTMHFKLLWEELTWIVPPSKKTKIEYFINMGYSQQEAENLIKELPGIKHFVFTHIFIPCLPLILYFFTKG